jgi:TPR repeat protein
MLAQVCGDLAYLYQRGQDVARDDAMALRLYKRGCDGGYAEACKMVLSR